MILLLGAAFVIGRDETRLADLVDRLKDESPAVRERAEREPVGMGEAILPALQKRAAAERRSNAGGMGRPGYRPVHARRDPLKN